MSKTISVTVCVSLFCIVSFPGTSAELPHRVRDANTVQIIEHTNAIDFDTFHVQGLVVTEDFYYLTSVDRAGRKAWIFKIDRKDMSLVLKRDITIGKNIHPGGFDYDGTSLWVPVAEYRKKSHAYMLALSPDTLSETSRFECDDHIGAVARHENVLIGANWDSEFFYFWDLDGNLLDKRKNPTGAAYQDCKGTNGFMVGVGGRRLDWIDVGQWKCVKRFSLDTSDQGSLLGREGFALFNDRVFFLPDDGPNSKVYTGEFVSEGK